MPPVKCHPELGHRRWTAKSINMDHACPYYAARSGSGYVVKYVTEADYRADELRKKADEFGLTYPSRATKRELVELINNYLKE